MKHLNQYVPQHGRNLSTLIFDSFEKTNTSSVSNLPYDRIAYDSTNGFWSTSLNETTHRTGHLIHSGLDLILPELGLQIPSFNDFERSCIYEPFVKVHRGSGDAAELNRQRNEKFTHNDDSVVLRTASYGLVLAKTDMCAQRRSTIGKGGVGGRQGLGDDLQIVAGLISSLRYFGYMEGTRKLCANFGLRRSKDD